TAVLRRPLATARSRVQFSYLSSDGAVLRLPVWARGRRRTAAVSGEDSLEVVDPDHVPAQDQLLFILRHVDKVAGDRLARLREGRIEVRVVRAPHHLVHADQITAAHAGHIVLEGGIHLATPVVSRTPRELRKTGGEGPGVPPQPLQVVRDPADVVLNRDEL